MDKTTSKIGSLSSNLATFLYMIHDKGIKIQDQTISDVCHKIDSESKKLSLSETAELFNNTLPNEIAIEHNTIETFLLENAKEDTFRSADIFDLAKELIGAIESTLSNDASFEETLSWLQNRIPQIKSNFAAETRSGKIHAIRHYEFQQSMPWIARIANRTEEHLAEQWIMVEKVTETVHCMDPNPWDDIEEESSYSLNDFMIRWELCGYASIFLGE